MEQVRTSPSVSLMMHSYGPSFVGLFELECYGPVNIGKVMLSWSVNLLTLFLDSFSPLNS